MFYYGKIWLAVFCMSSREMKLKIDFQIHGTYNYFSFGEHVSTMYTLQRKRGLFLVRLQGKEINNKYDFAEISSIL